MDHILLGYVIGYRHISPFSVLQVRAAIQKFIEDFQLSEDDYPFDSALTRFYNLYDDLIAYNKSLDNTDKTRWRRMQKRNNNKDGKTRTDQSD